MTSVAQFESPMENSSNSAAAAAPEAPKSPFSDLRGVQWRINLGILPHCSSSIDELRRVTADFRRRYASLRRRLLVESNFSKDGSNSPDLVMDNPLSQNPDSMWGRFFRNAELEKMVDQDLSRLYPEHGSYFQSAACQGMLRRILLLWCLRHPEYGYRQGMHELLAPLLYVLQFDVERLSQIRKLYEDHFTDKFDDLSFPASDLVGNYKSLNWPAENDDDKSFEGSEAKVCSLDELDPEIQTVVLLSDAYGAEGELGILLSERFMEHDAYCMFDALMGGARGAVAMADFFSPSPAAGSHTGLPPVIEASSALYHLLSVVDSSLHSHLVELGVEPQYFALRWLRVLFGREFLLEDLLVIWDEIFAAENGKSACSVETDVGTNYRVLCSPRGAFISAMAVSMLLYLRSSLLATENATSCLQRLLKFPENIDVKKLIRKAKSLQTLALETSSFSLSSFPVGTLDRSKSSAVRVSSLPSGSVSPRTPLSLVPESYWEEKWRVFHKPEEVQQGSSGKKVSTGKQGFSEKLRLSLARTESAPTPSKAGNGTKESRSSVRRRLLEDLSRELGTEDLEKVGCSEASDPKGPSTSESKVEERSVLMDRIAENGSEKNFSCGAEDTCLSGNTGSEDGSFIFSASSSPFNMPNDHENDSEKSSVGSNSGNDRDNDSEKVSVSSRLSIDGNFDDTSNAEKPCTTVPDRPPLPVSHSNGGVVQKSQAIADAAGKQIMAMKDKKLLSGKLQWIFKFGRNASETAPEKASQADALRSSCVESNQNNVCISSSAEGCSTSQMDKTDQKRTDTLRNLGQSMLENIQVIESVFQQDKGQVGSLENLSKNILVGKGQVTAVTALKELRKISNLLSEM